MGNNGHLEEMIRAALMLGHFDQLDKILGDSVKAGVEPSIIRNAYTELDIQYTVLGCVSS